MRTSRLIVPLVPLTAFALVGCSGSSTPAPSSPAAGAGASSSKAATAGSTSAGSGTATSGSTSGASTSPSSTSTPTDQPSTPATTEPGTLTHQARTATVALNGDLLWHNTLWKAAKIDARAAGRTGADDYDFYPTLAPTKPFLESADLALCHNDIPAAPRGGPYINYPVFSVPPQTIDVLPKLGYDLCTTGSNHLLDQGFKGLVRTVGYIEENGLINSGATRTQEESEKIPMFTTKGGVKIAVLSGTYSTNGIPKPTGKEWCLINLEPTSVWVEKAKKARAEGADIVMAVMQAGDEYTLYPNEQQKRTARELTASPDIDIVINHHSHVVNPWEKVNGKWVVYGLGNTVSDQRLPETHDGVIARFTFTEVTDGRFQVTLPEYVPTMTTRYVGGPVRVLPVVSALASGNMPYTSRGQLTESLERTKKRIAALGAPGLVLR